jgi:hypothetical protein
MLPMSALKLSNPMVFGVGMVAHNLSLHANMIARAHTSGAQPYSRNRLQREADVTTGARILIARVRYRGSPDSLCVNPFERNDLRLDRLVMR